MGFNSKNTVDIWSLLYIYSKISFLFPFFCALLPPFHGCSVLCHIKSEKMFPQTSSNWKDWTEDMLEIQTRRFLVLM